MDKVGTYQVQATLTLAARWLEIHDFFAKRYRCKWQDGQLSVILRPPELINTDPFAPPESSPWTEIIIQPAIKGDLLHLSMTLRMHTDRKGQVYDDRPAFQEITEMLRLAFPAPEGEAKQDVPQVALQFMPKDMRERREQVKELWEEGLTDKAISQRLGWSPEVIKKDRMALGLKKRQRKRS